MAVSVTRADRMSQRGMLFEGFRYGSFFFLSSQASPLYTASLVDMDTCRCTDT